MDDWKTQLVRVGAQAGMAYCAWDGHPEGSKFDRMSDEVKGYFERLVNAMLEDATPPVPDFIVGHEAGVVLHIAAAAIQAVIDSNNGGVQLRLTRDEAKQLDRMLDGYPGNTLAEQVQEALVA